jgi:hypothetical protein
MSTGLAEGLLNLLSIYTTLENRTNICRSRQA